MSSFKPPSLFPTYLICISNDCTKILSTLDLDHFTMGFPSTCCRAEHWPEDYDSMSRLIRHVERNVGRYNIYFNSENLPPSEIHTSYNREEILIFAKFSDTGDESLVEFLDGWIFLQPSRS